MLQRIKIASNTRRKSFVSTSTLQIVLNNWTSHMFPLYPRGAYILSRYHSQCAGEAGAAGCGLPSRRQCYSWMKKIHIANLAPYTNLVLSCVLRKFRNCRHRLNSKLRENTIHNLTIFPISSTLTLPKHCLYLRTIEYSLQQHIE